MVSALVPGVSSPGSNPGRGHCVVFLGMALSSQVKSSQRWLDLTWLDLTLTVPLSTQVYKWVLANLMMGVTRRWISIPSRGGVEILLVTSCYGNRDKLRASGPLGSYADFTLPIQNTQSNRRSYLWPINCNSVAQCAFNQVDWFESVELLIFSL